MDEITYTCESGFELNDGTASQTHICNATGQWNMTAPTCQGIMLTYVEHFSLIVNQENWSCKFH